MHKPTHWLAFSLLTLWTAASTADVPNSQHPEVYHLLSFVESSPCLFHRNGDTYSGEKAVKHIQRKYDHYRDDITTTETFIQYSASKSMLSGKRYTVTCPDKTESSTEQWLIEELKRFRQLRN